MGFFPAPGVPQQPIRQVNRPRSLVSIVTHEEDAAVASEPARPQRHLIENGKGRKRAHTNDVTPMPAAQPLMSIESGSSLFGAPPVQMNPQPPVQVPQLGHKSPFSRGTNTALVVRKIPKELNVEEKIREHFERFGRLVHVEVNFGGAPDAALVRFGAPNEANAAYRCPESVFNNRFIRLYWFNGATGGGGLTSKRPIEAASGSAMSPKSEEPSLKRHVRERLEFKGAAPVPAQTGGAVVKQEILISKENKINEEAVDAGAAGKEVVAGDKTHVLSQAAMERKENQAAQNENLKVIFKRFTKLRLHTG